MQGDHSGFSNRRRKNPARPPASTNGMAMRTPGPVHNSHRTIGVPARMHESHHETPLIAEPAAVRNNSNAVIPASSHDGRESSQAIASATATVMISANLGNPEATTI